MSKVFISYARENIAIVKQLAAELAAEGVDAWFDSELEPGEFWKPALESRIQNCDFFLFCLSTELVQRQTSFAYEELDFALAHRGAPTLDDGWLVPVSFDSCTVPDRLLASKVRLAEIHAIALRPGAPEWRDQVSRLLRRVQPTFKVRPEMVRVPPRAQKQSYEQVRSFLIGKYPVTQHEWVTVMGTNPSRFKGDPNRPVENVSWTDAQDFISRVNGARTLKCRLPTEQEWIYACLAGASGEYGVPFPHLTRYAWFSTLTERRAETRPVYERTPNAWGIHDMLGNVCEWVSDTVSTGSPTRTSLGRQAISKGGSYDGGDDFCRVSSSTSLDIGFRYDNLGFRLAADDDVGTSAP